MKKLLLLTLSVLLISAVNSQVVIDSNSMPVPHNIIKMRTTNSVNGANYTAGGANHIWNFTALTTTAQVIDTFVSVFSTDIVYVLVFGSSSDPVHFATVASKVTMPAIPTVTITDAYSFQKNSYSQFSEVGVGAQINGMPIPLKFDLPDVRYKFPVTFGTTDSSKSKFSANVPGLGYFGEKRSRVNVVDGWGTIYLPNDTFNVIRVKSTVKNSDSIYVTSLGFGTTINRVVTEYKWLTPSIHEPVLQVDATTSGVAVRYYSHLPFSSINEYKNSSEQVKIFPNPATDKLTITMTDNSSKYNVSIMDITGNIVQQEYLVNGNEMIIPVNNLVKGLYFITFENSEKRFTRKFVKE